MSDLIDIRFTDAREEDAHYRRFIEQHSGHRQHLCEENILRCSCGEALGHIMSTEGELVPPQPCQVCKVAQP